MPQATIKAKTGTDSSSNGFSEKSGLAYSAADRFIKFSDQKWPTDPQERKEFEIKWRNKIAEANRDWDRAFGHQNGNGSR